MTKPFTKKRVIIVAKAPIPGFAKTRLIPSLGIEAAAALAKKLLAHTIKEISLATVDSYELCVAPEKNHPAWQEFNALDFKNGSQFNWVNQVSGDLGERLTDAVKRSINAEESAILIGTDCPSINAELIERVAERLEEVTAVIIPATDGGYVLLAINQFDASIFSNIEWSTDKVYTETISRIEALGWSYIALPALHDIDTAEDLKYLPPLLIESGLE